MTVLDTVLNWVVANLTNLIISGITILLSFIIYNFISVRLEKLLESHKIKLQAKITLDNILKILFIAFTILFILNEFGVKITSIVSIISLFGGTVVGFASINTLGNAIAGLIIMMTRPFTVGDRIYLNNEFMDVLEVDFIYTQLRTLDNVIVSIPNQKFLTIEVNNYGTDRQIRRKYTITPGFSENPEKVEKTLLEVASKSQNVLKIPKPYVRITDFQNFAVQYTLYLYLSDVKKLREIDADLRRSILMACKKNKIDISTPTLIKKV